jgi:hypothetical protein
MLSEKLVATFRSAVAGAATITSRVTIANVGPNGGLEMRFVGTCIDVALVG